ncbi:MAG: hypothetical protein NVSMB24_38700 [Mucilaginibacter sp.]
METLKRISFDGGDFIWFQPYCISFRFKGLFNQELPKSIHFTLAYNEGSPDINLHVTNNLSDEYDKPKVVIADVNKKILKERAEAFGGEMLRLFLEPVNFQVMQKRPKWGRHQQTTFLSFDDLEKASLTGDYRDGFYQTLKQHFPQKKGKGRYRMMPSLPRGLKKWAKSNWNQQIIRDHLKPFHLSAGSVTQQAGYFRSTAYSGLAILYNGIVYRIRNDITPRQLAEAFLGVPVVEQLLQQIRMAIAITDDAENYSQTHNIMQPIRLFSPLDDV